MLWVAHDLPISQATPAHRFCIAKVVLHITSPVFIFVARGGSSPGSVGFTHGAWHLLTWEDVVKPLLCFVDHCVLTSQLGLFMSWRLGLCLLLFTFRCCCICLVYRADVCTCGGSGRNLNSANIWASIAKASSIADAIIIVSARFTAYLRSRIVIIIFEIQNLLLVQLQLLSVEERARAVLGFLLRSGGWPTTAIHRRKQLLATIRRTGDRADEKYTHGFS